MQRCDKCTAYVPFDKSPGKGTCQAHPPVPFVLGAKPGQVAGLNGNRVMSLMIQSVYPEVDCDSGKNCREFIEADAVANLSEFKFPTLSGEVKIG